MTTSRIEPPELEPDLVIRPSASTESARDAVEVDSVRIILEEVTVKENRDLGSAEIYLATVFVDDASPEPQVVDLPRFWEDVKDGEKLQLGQSGLQLYRSEPDRVPRAINWHIAIMESDKELRELGKRINEVRNDETYKSLLQRLKEAIAAGRPDLALATELADYAFALLGHALELNRDDQIFYAPGTFDEHDLLGAAHGPIVHDGKFARVQFRSHVDLSR